jgi:hypothetical protein
MKRLESRAVSGVSAALASIGALPRLRWRTYFSHSVTFRPNGAKFVSNLFKKPVRPWRVVADEMSHANRGDRILELAEELERAFQEQMPAPSKSVQAVVPAAAESGGDSPNKPQQRKQS